MSVYLDAVRFLAALLVLLGHAATDTYNGHWLDEIFKFRAFFHDAVIVFFVLSGYVIYYVALTKEVTLKSYVIARLSRIYSVAISAIIISSVIGYIGYNISPLTYDDILGTVQSELFRIIQNIFFLNQLWYKFSFPFSNVPYWSLGYEVWYYIIFGIFFYLRGIKRLILTTLTLVIMGPKILLLLPIWILGCYIYKISQTINFSPWQGVILFFFPVICYLLYKALGLHNELSIYIASIIGPEEQLLLKHSSNFLSDYIVAILISIHFIGVNTISANRFNINRKLEQIIRWLAGYTFTLYLLHVPLLRFLSIYIHNVILLIFATLIIIIIVGNFTEKKKWLYKDFLIRVWNK